jgi:hypothetical protein
MRTNLGLLDVGSTWVPFPEVARNILTDLLLERYRSRKFNFRFTEFYEVSRKAPGQVAGWWRTRSNFLPQVIRLAAYGSDATRILGS